MLVRIATGIFVALTVSGCRPALSEKERLIVGTWDRTGMDFTERTTYRPDHTLESTYDSSDPKSVAKGTWRLEGDTLVEEVIPPWQPVPNETPFPKQTYRMPILEFQADKLVREPGRPPLVRVK
jgi:hypothetical protein